MSDLDDFLKQAAERRRAKQAKKNKPAPPPQPVRQLERRPIEILEPEIIDEAVEEAIVAEPVSQSLRDRHLAVSDLVSDGAELAHQRMESHVTDVFDHQVGRLTKHSIGSNKLAASKSAISDDAFETRNEAAHQTAEEIRDMLANPQSVRAAFILSEIFERKYF